MDFLLTILYLLFVLSAIILVVVILLQEGKGGGFGAALGTAGQQAFGVQTKGIQTFTGVVAGIFMVSAVTIHIVSKQASSTSLVPEGPSVTVPADGAGAGAPPTNTDSTPDGE